MTISIPAPRHAPLALVEQVEWNDCAAACLATVTGESLAAVKRRVAVPTTHGEIEAYLTDHALSNDLVTVRGRPTVAELARQRRPFVRDLSFERRTLVLSVAAPCPGIDWHAVVLDRGRVLDPGGHFDRGRLLAAPCIWATEVYPDERATAVSAPRTADAR